MFEKNNTIEHDRGLHGQLYLLDLHWFCRDVTLTDVTPVLIASRIFIGP